jgi:hypothetical protein
MASATSSGVAHSSSLVTFLMCSGASVQRGVFMTPGATAVTRMPSSGSRRARERTKPEMAYLEAMYYTFLSLRISNSPREIKRC